MTHLLITTIAAVLLVGCGESQQSSPPAKPVKPVAEAATSEPSTAKAPDISIYQAVGNGNIEAVKQHIAAGTDVNAKAVFGWTLLLQAVAGGHKEIVELLIDNGADVNGKTDEGWIPLSLAACESHKEIVELLISEALNTNELKSPTSSANTVARRVKN